jgi:hypothetical protein
MSTEPVYILTLNETLPKKLEQLLNNETKERLKDELGRIKNHFVNVESLAGASSESARAVFQQMWSKLLASAAQIQADKKDVILNLLQEFKLDESDEALTLLSPIKNFDDFTFFAPKDCERATLLRLLYGKSEDLVSQLTEGDPLPPTPEDSAGKNDPAADLQRRALELSASKRLNKIVGKIAQRRTLAV